MKKAIIIGASSGIGRALAKILADAGYVVGLTARRLPLLLELQKEIAGNSFVKQMDVADTDSAMLALSELLQEMRGAELIVICAGVGFINRELKWSKECETIAVNVAGFAAIANVAFRHFWEAGSGHLVNISSIAAIRGNGSTPAYNASKAFESNYMDGLRHKAAKLQLPITVTDVQPGFVDTPMAKGEGRFWMASAEVAATQIYRAIVHKKKHVYVTKHWRLIAWLLKLLPDSMYYKI